MSDATVSIPSRDDWRGQVEQLEDRPSAAVLAAFVTAVLEQNMNALIASSFELGRRIERHDVAGLEETADVIYAALDKNRTNRRLRVVG
jgi:hypothetical protein